MTGGGTWLLFWLMIWLIWPAILARTLSRLVTRSLTPIHDVFTLVQYKRLELCPSTSGATDVWMYGREGELRDQLDLMPALDLKAETSVDWRMTGSPFWFKFVRSDAATVQDQRLLGGMYVPAGYLRLAIGDGSLRTGPRGGFRVTHGNTRHLDRDAFVHLVKNGLIGTMTAQSADLHRVITDLTAAGRSVVLAVKSNWQKLVEPRARDFED